MVRKTEHEEQIIAVLNEAEAGAKTRDLCRKHGVSNATFYKWKAKYAGMSVSELKRLRSIEDENRRLKQIVAQQALDNWALKARRLATTYAIEGLGLSERRACLLVGVSSSVYRYEPKRGDDDALRRRMRELAGERKRFGSPRLHIMLKREGGWWSITSGPSAFTTRRGLPLGGRGGVREQQEPWSSFRLPSGVTRSGRWTSSPIAP